jgi:DnaJ-like protein
VLNEPTILDYQTLHLKPGASKEEIRQAYRDLVRVWHPDRFVNDPRLRLIAEEKLISINQAYTRLNRVQISEPDIQSARDTKPHSPVPETRFARLSGWLQDLAPRRPSLSGWLFVRSAHLAVAAAGTIFLLTFGQSIIEPFESKYSPLRQALRLQANNPPLQLPDALDVTRISRYSDVLPDSKAADVSPELVSINRPAVNHQRTFRSAKDFSPIRERPQSGTILAGYGDLRGAGTLAIENQSGSDAVVILATASQPGMPLRSVYVRAEEKVTISGISTGVYVATANTGVKWESGNRRLRYDLAAPVRLGTFQFLQVVSPMGIECDQYKVVMKRKS